MQPDLIVEFLKRGYSTVIMPDGPNGPSQVIKNGVLHMSQQSGVPIVPVKYTVSKIPKIWRLGPKKMAFAIRRNPGSTR